jgi:hypothetical protein
MAFGLAPLFARRMKKPLAKVSFASGFSYLSDALEDCTLKCNNR